MKINRAFIKGTNWALAGLIGLLGFTGCEKDDPGVDYTVMDYTVKGTVVNKADGKPIAGIRVGYGPEYKMILMYGPPPAPYEPKTFVLTGANGEFKLSDRFHAGEHQVVDNKPVLSVYVEDIDGEENGWFHPEYLQIDVSKAEPGGIPKGWYKGEFTVNVNVELSEIETE
jgi:putative lipoprotein (rSAM/lipoprotein system)